MDELEGAKLKTADVARIFNCSVTLLHKAWRAGLFPEPLRIGPRTFRWREQEIRQFLKDGGKVEKVRGNDKPREYLVDEIKKQDVLT